MHQHLARCGIERHGGHTVLCGHVGGELAEQQRDVLRPLAQRRHRDRHRAEAVVQVFAETPRSDGLLEVHIRGGNDADIGFLHLGRPDADKLARLQHAQQARLGRVRQLGDFVEEDRPPVGLLEIALAGFERPGEGAFLMPEEFRIDGTFGNRRAVDGYIFIVFARRIGVDDLRKELLAHAALARDKDGQVGGGHTHGDLQRPV